MGNRAVITTQIGWAAQENHLGLYLHWNGGRDSVQGFLSYCDLRGFRAPDSDDYGWACLAGIIHNFFGDGLSCGLDIVSKLDQDNYDNGVYVIKGWEIVGRHYMRGSEQNEYGLEEFMNAVDEAQPKKLQVGPEKIKEYVKKRREKEKAELLGE